MIKNSYYNRHAHILTENKNSAKNTAILFANKLNSLYSFLNYFINYNEDEWSNDNEINTINAVKTSYLLHDMYINDDAFIPEISEETGFLAGKLFSMESERISGMDFPDMLEFIGNALNGFLNDEDNDEELLVVVEYMPLIHNFLRRFRRDYSIKESYKQINEMFESVEEPSYYWTISRQNSEEETLECLYGAYTPGVEKTKTWDENGFTSPNTAFKYGMRFLRDNFDEFKEGYYCLEVIDETTGDIVKYTTIKNGKIKHQF